ncbi:substrate-binding domain-containing protein [Agromyces albus]|jgi:simple sugar transport system substrate-binding protein|uniref:substrate-binding domain-containing protein n=1 Tax=Agromyces albus TaxID=205332 RepID=UPI002782BFD5|nr:substrate-binding domain-containing protein [Agromyces albus]MDQ0575863.1 simple sugar transport system substrate-binding protein [Agromyces albus]
MKNFHRRALVALAAAPLIAVLAACTAGGGESEANGAATAEGEQLKVALITHAVPGDTFWDIIRKGADAAATKDNVEVLYSSDPDGGKQAQLVQQAVDQGVDGIVVTLAKPDALEDSVKAALAAGIPVFSINAGENESREFGVLAHFGQNETVAGQAVGEQLNAQGSKKTICIIQEQGQVALEQRCAGVKDTFAGAFEVLYVNSADMAGSSSTITAKLQTDGSIDSVVALAAPIALAAIDAAKDAGSSAKIGTFDLSSDAVDALKAGDLAFLVDQQPYLQGYSGIDAVWLQLTNGNVLGGGAPVFTGPAIVTADNVDAVAGFAANGTR